MLHRSLETETRFFFFYKNCDWWIESVIHNTMNVRLGINMYIMFIRTNIFLSLDFF